MLSPLAPHPPQLDCLDDLDRYGSQLRDQDGQFPLKLFNLLSHEFLRLFMTVKRLLCSLCACELSFHTLKLLVLQVNRVGQLVEAVDEPAERSGWR